MKKLWVLFSLLTLLFTNTFAQQSINASGSSVQTSGGSVSYSVGQIDYHTINSASGTISQGVQQPFEIFEIGISENNNICISAKLFPNPTTDYLQLQINFNDKQELNEISYLLLDINGKVLSKEIIIEEQSIITMAHFAVGTYFLNIVSKNSILKSFKIIKN